MENGVDVKVVFEEEWSSGGSQSGDDGSQGGDGKEVRRNEVGRGWEGFNGG